MLMVPVSRRPALLLRVLKTALIAAIALGPVIAGHFA